AMQNYAGGDGGYTAIDPTAGSTTIYTEYPYLSIARHSSTINPSDPTSPFTSFVDAGPCREFSTDPACSDPAGFVAPFRMDPANPQRLIAGTNKVYLTNNGGGSGGPASWTLISPDVTTGTVQLSYGDSINAMVMGARGV